MRQHSPFRSCYALPRPAVWAASFALHAGALTALWFAPMDAPSASDAEPAVAEPVMAVRLVQAERSRRLVEPPRPVPLVPPPPPAVAAPRLPALADAPPHHRPAPPAFSPSHRVCPTLVHPHEASAPDTLLAATPTLDLPPPKTPPPYIPPAPEPSVPLRAIVHDAVAEAENPPPHYPRIARRLGYEGLVVLRAHVSAEGQCLGVEVAESSGYPVLDRAAAEAVKQWSFHPARAGGEPRESHVDVPIRFRLTDR